MTTFDAFFSVLTGQPSAKPHDWQEQLAAQAEPRSRLIRIPTGMGKTLGVLAAWSWHRLHRSDDRWPRRLVWCLPMRVLVEQTTSVVEDALGRLGILWDGSGDHAGKVGVHVLMGGADPGGDWNLYPEECAVLVGTQDMLLSRALNRGYGSGRARWPLEFGLLSHDALWVMDEVQLMDVGMATSGQLQAFHDADAPRGFRSRFSWWMSATLQPSWLKTVDTDPSHADWVREPTALPPAQRRLGLGAVPKRLALESITEKDAKALARRALREHVELSDGERGRITLVICNTVERATATFDAIRAEAPQQEVVLVHSRFRSAEREAWRSKFLSRATCTPGADRILVATQVVEAGVDISAGCVITELAPWSSLVQRFGRCARYGGAGAVIVVDRGRDEKVALPYSPGELDAAHDALSAIMKGSADVGLASLEDFEDTLAAAGLGRLYPYEPRHLLLRRELDELFDTTPDLTGADLDVSRFLRSGEERDVLVFWKEMPKQKRGAPAPRPASRTQPRREELCAVPFMRAREWLCGPETKSNRKPKLRTGMRAWVWDWIEGRWEIADRAALRPGRVVCVAAECGGYSIERGFDPDHRAKVQEVPLPPLSAMQVAQLQADESNDGDELSAAAWKTIACHGREVGDEAERIGNAIGLPPDLCRVLVLAGRWHDFGKAHPAFQGGIRFEGRPERQDLAKAPDGAWPKPPKTYRTADDDDVRPGLRHELASALSLFAVLERYQPLHPALLGPWAEVLRAMDQEVHAEAVASDPTPLEREVLACSAEQFDLLAYLVACHHGKVRVALHASPKDQAYRTKSDDHRGPPIRGVRDGDAMPAIALDDSGRVVPALSLTLAPATLGLSAKTGRSWQERAQGLQDRFGPGCLAWLEALLIAADRRASRLETPDPLLAATEEGAR